jgi:hypothetical protein
LSHNGPNPDHPVSGLQYPKDPGLRALLAWRKRWGWEDDPDLWVLNRAYELINAGWNEHAAVAYLMEGGT